jgi:hypothetical protein
MVTVADSFDAFGLPELEDPDQQAALERALHCGDRVRAPRTFPGTWWVHGA